MVVKFLRFTWRDKIVTISRLGIYTVTPRTTTKETVQRDLVKYTIDILEFWKILTQKNAEFF